MDLNAFCEIEIFGHYATARREWAPASSSKYSDPTRVAGTKIFFRSLPISEITTVWSPVALDKLV